MIYSRMPMKKSPSQSSRPTSTPESLCNLQGVKTRSWSSIPLERRIYLWQMLIFPLVPIALLVAQNAYSIFHVSVEYNAAHVLEEQVCLKLNVLLLNHKFTKIGDFRIKFLKNYYYFHS